MFGALKKILGIRATNHSETSTASISLFSGSAYFSNRVPKAFIEKWVAHGGEVSSGTTLDVRARYFFAMDPSEPWVTKLFAKSVVVIHAGWIVHSAYEAFRVPIAEYILDGRPFNAVIMLPRARRMPNVEMFPHSIDRFVPGPPYRLTNIAPPTYVPLVEPRVSTDSESGESGPTPVRTDDMPSTPTIMRRKRKREQAYFDSPSGSLVFSGFDKDGMPRRPRKQRRLRFDPSFSPVAGRSQARREVMRETSSDWLRRFRDMSRSDGVFSKGRYRQDTDANALRGQSRMTTKQMPDTPSKPLASDGSPATYQCLSLDEHLSKRTRVFSPTTSADMREKLPPVRTADFTNLLPPSRRWRWPLPPADTTNSRDTGTMLSSVKSDYKVKTPKKISFASQAQVCVYAVSPGRPDANNGASAGPARRPFDARLEDGPNTNDKTRLSGDEAEGADGSTDEAIAINDLVLRADSPTVNGDDGARLLGGDQFDNDTLTLAVEDVQAMRRRLVETAVQNGVDDGPLATSFELGKTFRGMAFRHVW